MELNFGAWLEWLGQFPLRLVFMHELKLYSFAFSELKYYMKLKKMKVSMALRCTGGVRVFVSGSGMHPNLHCTHAMTLERVCKHLCQLCRGQYTSGGNVKSFGCATHYIAQSARGQFTLQSDFASWIHESKQKMR